MTGGIIVTHAGFAEGLKEAVEMIAGKQEDLAAIGLREGDGMETLMEKIREAAKTMSCKKIWLFCDMFGATPCNAGCMLASQEDYEVITGVSLPILLDFVMSRAAADEEELRSGIEQTAKEAFRWITKKDLL